MTRAIISELTQVSEFRFKLYPKDFAKVRAFYEIELGFKVLNEWDRPGSQGTMFDVGGTILELLTPEKGDQPVVGCDLSLEVPDVLALHEAMKDKDYVTRGLKHNSWGDTSFHIVDPEGFAITFFSRDKE